MEKQSTLHRITQQTSSPAENRASLRKQPDAFPALSAPVAPAAYLGRGGHWQTDRLCAAARCR